MSVREHDWMGQILGVSAPWQVTDVRLLASTGVVSVQIEQPDSGPRFWLGRRGATPVKRLRWDHIGLAGHRCEVVVLLRAGQAAPEASWTGEVDMPFTRGLSRLVLDLLLEGATMSQLCRMLELPFSDLWKYKYRLDQGVAQVPAAANRPASSNAAPESSKPTAAVPGMPVLAALQAATPASTPANPLASTLAGTPTAQTPQTLQTPPAQASGSAAPIRVDVVLDVGDDAGLPPADSPIWLALLKGKLALDVQALSLKLLLTKTLREAQQHSDADLHAQAAQALHRYFERNQPVLGHEIHQLAQAHKQSLLVGDTASFALPDASDPLWLALLQGERDLDVRALGLRLLLSRLRGQAKTLQNEEVRMLKLVELHRFFEKNQAVLRHEISQLQHWAVH